MSTPLTIIPTPVGNLEDMTYRAVRILREADLILAEDTRTSATLLREYGIETPMISYHIFNEHKIVERVTEEIAQGRLVCLISDAGTPGISDPGFLLVLCGGGYRGELSAGGHSCDPCRRCFRTSVRSLCLRGLFATQEGTSHQTKGAGGAGGDYDIL